MFENLDLSTITKIAEENFMPQPFIVGGAVRDFLFGQKKFEDIDITIFSKDFRYSLQILHNVLITFLSFNISLLAFTFLRSDFS